MALRLCPGCKQNADRDLGFCSLCGYDFSSDKDDAFNRRIVLWGRIATALCALICIISIWSTGRRPGLADYRDLLVYTSVPAAVFWGFLKLTFSRSRRKLWTAALIPSFFIASSVFAWRAWQAPGSSLSLQHMLNASYGLSGPVQPSATQASMVIRPGSRATSGPVTAEPADPSAPLFKLANECFNYVRKQPDFIVSEIKGAGVQKMLAPGSLEDRKQLDASRARLRKLQDRIADYDARIRRSATDLTVKIQQVSGAPGKVKANVLAEVRRSGGELVRGVMEYTATQRKSLAAVDETLAFLRARADRFTVVHKRPMFADAADSRKYDELRKQIDDLNAKADQMLPLLRVRGEQAIRELNSPSDIGLPTQAQASGAGGS
jgi:hypothetical protein